MDKMGTEPILIVTIHNTPQCKFDGDQDGHGDGDGMCKQAFSAVNLPQR